MRRTVLVPLLASFAAFYPLSSIAPVSAAPTCSAPSGSQVRLSAQDLASPTPLLICQARLALQGHAVVAAVGGKAGMTQLGRVLGVQLPEPSATLSPRSSVPSNVTTVFQGVHFGLNGVTNVYQGQAAAGGESQAAVQFNQWIAGQTAAHASAPMTSSALAAGAPSGAAWTQLNSAVSAYTDYQGTSVHFAMTDYRLNDINSGTDWYLFATQLQTAPNYQGCSYSTVCGPYTIWRNVRIPAPAPLALADYGPQGTVTSSTAGYTVGGGLGTDVGAGVSASYSQTWDQPSVVTTDQTSYPNITAAWQESFGGPSYFWWPVSISAPPGTSTGSFQSDQAAIFSAPEGTSSFTLTGYAGSETEEDSNFHACWTWLGTMYLCYSSGYSGVNLSIRMTVQPPVLAVSPSGLSLSRGSSGTISIQAVVPGSSQGLAWDVTNIPSWLSVSSLSGSGVGSVTVTVNRKTPIGSVAYLNFNTSPAFAAPSVERGPIVVQIVATK